MTGYCKSRVTTYHFVVVPKQTIEARALLIADVEGADKSLARPTSRCRRTESILWLERGFCSCGNFKPFHVTGAEMKHVRRRA